MKTATDTRTVRCPVCRAVVPIAPNVTPVGASLALICPECGELSLSG